MSNFNLIPPYKPRFVLLKEYHNHFSIKFSLNFFLPPFSPALLSVMLSALVLILSIFVDTFFSKISLSSFRRRISLSCSLTRLRSIVISSDRLIAPAGVWEPSPISSLPALTAFIHVWMVPSGIPNSLAALAPPISLAGFTACTLYS